jgi:biopolymer transport protein ExbB
LFSYTDAHAWYDGKWQHRVKVQFDASLTGANIGENLTDVPVLVRLHTGNFSFADAKPDGSDLRFVSADDKSPLKHHIEKFDTTEEIALIWVKVPRISAGSDQDSVWMYYGNEAAPDGQDSGGTYDVNQVAVLHLGENEGNPRDATAYGNHATVFDGRLGLPSIVGGGVTFNGAASMKIARSPSLNFAKGFTFSAWVRPKQSSGTSCLFSWDDGNQSVTIGITESRAYCSMSMGDDQVVTTQSAGVLSPEQWHHLAVTIDPNEQVTLFINGAEDKTNAFEGTIPAPSADIFIGAAAGGEDAFAGDMDEVQISNVARPAGWVATLFQSQGAEGLLTSIMEPESGGGGGESLTIELMKVIVRTITLDGWVIIGICFLLGLGSMYIFVQKLNTLRQTTTENKQFMKSFRSADHPLGLLEKDQKFPASSLYRVYLAGCEELAMWLEKKENSMRKGKGVSKTIMNGFKAAIDKAAMMESRRLSAGMVVINMTVAGGPFLGLLGTVWGVMNTFAGLAESGEANLSAIAPGVASALACTLAGLLVAIPALFGSTYLNGHIKNLNADVNVFLDDYILKLEAEQGEIR